MTSAMTLAMTSGSPTALLGNSFVLQVAAGADLLLRAVVHKLLVGDGSASKDPSLAAALPQGRQAAAVRACVTYLMIRVGVPRDMAFPAARQFRAHLHWALGHLDKA